MSSAPSQRGHLRKMTSTLSDPVTYRLPVDDARLPLNDHIGSPIALHFSGEIHCVACGRQTSKSFNQGYCYPCLQRLAQCDSCIIKPELCHYHLGTCREPAWGERHCLQPHVVYLANSSGVKVGITRASQVPTRWIDQGASQALPIFQVRHRYLSGLLEMVFKQHLADRTDWRRMLKGPPPPVDLPAIRDQITALCQPDIDRLAERFGPDTIEPLPQAKPLTIDYPVRDYPAKVSALNLDKTPMVQGTLLGIKGQYLILDSGVLNIRKFSGYKVGVALG